MAFQKVSQATADFCQWLNDALVSVDRNNMVACYRLSFEAHFRLVTIHPWVDGNGRTTRLLMNIIQRQLGLIPSIVTKEAKGEYIQALIDSREQEDSTIIQDVMLAQHITNLENRILQYQQSINDTVNNRGDTVNDTATRFITLIKAHPEYTYDEYAKALNIGRATVARYIKKLNGTVIKRIGSDKNGHWEIITNGQTGVSYGSSSGSLTSIIDFYTMQVEKKVVVFLCRLFLLSLGTSSKASKSTMQRPISKKY